MIRKLSLLLLLLLGGNAMAADTKISALPAASALTGVEAFPCVQSGVTDKCTATQAVTFTYSLLSGDCTATSGGAVTCTKTGGVAFGALATLASINNSNWSGAVLSVANGGNGTASPSLVGGSNITITGSWPNQTVTASGGSGSVTSVGWTGGIVSIATPTTTPAFTIAGTSGGIPYFSSATTWASSALLGAGLIVTGGGAATAPATITLGGDCTFSTPNITCTKTGGVAFGSLATLSTINNSNWSGTALAIGNGGTGQTTANAAFNALSPMTTAGDIIYGGTAGAGTRLAKGTGTQVLLGGTTPSWGSVDLANDVGSTILPIANGGTNAATANAGFNNLSPMTTVGDIIYGDASGVATRLANGTSGQFLGANTGAAPSWQTPAGGSAPTIQTYSTSRLYTLFGTSSLLGAASTANVITCVKGQVFAELTFSVLTVNISTAGTTNIQAALYKDTNGLPGTLLSSTPSVADTGTLGTNLTLSSHVQVGPGSTYGQNSVWFCTNQNDSTVVMTSNNRNGVWVVGPVMGGDTGSSGLAALVTTAGSHTGISCAGANCNGGSSTFGTWPDLTGTTWTRVTAATSPIPFFTPFSVP